jgi:hypothetical protein
MINGTIRQINCTLTENAQRPTPTIQHPIGSAAKLRCWMFGVERQTSPSSGFL